MAKERGQEPIRIREAVESDLPRLMELLFELAQLGERPEAEARAITANEVAALRTLQTDPQATCLVLERAGRIEGTVTLYVLPGLSHGGRSFGIIENVVVAESAQGRGLGRALMEGAERRALEAGCYKLALASNQRRTEAHGFYQTIGFNPTHQGFTKYF
jgi:GNAT superfamily N-acetyltransferase